MLNDADHTVVTQNFPTNSKVGVQLLYHYRSKKSRQIFPFKPYGELFNHYTTIALLETQELSPTTVFPNPQGINKFSIPGKRVRSLSSPKCGSKLATL